MELLQQALQFSSLITIIYTIHKQMYIPSYVLIRNYYETNIGRRNYLY